MTTISPEQRKKAIKIYKTSTTTFKLHQTPVEHQDNSPRINRGTGYDNQRAVNVAGARENVGTLVVQKSGIQCYMQRTLGMYQGMSETERVKEIGKAHLYVHLHSFKRLLQIKLTYSDQSLTDETLHKTLRSFQAELDKYNDGIMAFKGKPAIFSDSLAKTDFSKSKPVTTQNVSYDFSKPVTAQILPQNVLPIFKNTNVIAPGMYKVHTKPNQTRTQRLPQDIRKTNKRVSFSIGVIPTTSVSRPQLKSNQLEDRVMPNNSQGKKQEVEDHHRNFKFSNNKMSVTACNDSLNAKTSNVNFVCVTYGKCVLNDNHDLCVLHYINGVNSRTRQPMVVPISTREPKHNVEPFVQHPVRKLFMQQTPGIRHETSTARTPEQNGVVKRRNRTLVEAARTMLSAAKVPLFFWAEAIATACFTQNRSLVIPRHEKTPYHIINARKPSVKFFHIFGSLCYIVRDGENLDKMKEKGDACIFVGYSTQSKAYRMASDHVSSDPGPQCSNTVLKQDSLSPGPQSQENVSQAAEIETTSNELELLYSPMFSELLNGNSPVVSKSTSIEHSFNTSNSNSSTTITAPENIIQVETDKENAQFNDDEFINIFSTPVQESGETSSRHVDSSNMHTFYQHHPSAQRWTKDHPLEQVIGNPS
ncbi:retrovirus-related pol polyprotein from transposon TNT 1-94 [Tanacetum coccineum]